MNRHTSAWLGCVSFACVAVACAGGSASGPHASAGPSAGDHGAGPVASASPAPVPHVPPPETGPRREIHFPTVTRSTLANGLELNVVESHTLPIVHVRVVARAAGSSADPANLPGLAAFAGDMLKEGTRTHTSAQIAEAIEFMGGTLTVTTGIDDTVVAISVLRDHLEDALALLADVIVDPTFPPSEIDKLRRREIDRLTQMMEDPGWLSRREFYRAAYPGHPYGQIDTTPQALEHFTRDALVSFHRERFVSGSMFVAVVGDTRAADFATVAERTLGRVRRGPHVAIAFHPMPARTGRQVIIVDRPESAQSLIRIGNVSLPRASDDYVPLAVANQVLGGDAASRLFMDLRERRSLTYGAYSRLGAAVDMGTFQASGAVRTPVTGDALGAFFEHLQRIVFEAPPEPELNDARNFLIDQFPLVVETAADLANLLVELRLYGLPDGYWDTYRTRIAAVTPAQALQSAQRYIHPDQSVIVIVGPASAFESAAQHFGPVRVVDPAGRTLRELPSTAGAESGAPRNSAAPPPAPAT